MYPISDQMNKIHNPSIVYFTSVSHIFLRATFYAHLNFKICSQHFAKRNLHRNTTLLLFCASAVSSY